MGELSDRLSNPFATGPPIFNPFSPQMQVPQTNSPKPVVTSPPVIFRHLLF